MVCQGWHTEPSIGKDGRERQAIVFELRPLETITRVVDAEPESNGIDFALLRERAFAASSPSVGTRTSPRTVFQRAADVRNYVLARSNGKCEGCELDAPFARANGSPYLEPHHIRRVSDGGPDDPRFVIALCPNCHRRIHYGADGITLNATLNEKMKKIETGRPVRR
ncbi:HNH endonuclease [Rhizobium sp. NLR22b]|uniref:HNH endonuclease n=1 Tax=Rhizobium sp. NLR22b TaxID=2731115 RepID=UPI002180C531|nr:HNH endonuclease [Rhizobium sp. NLR22b]